MWYGRFLRTSGASGQWEELPELPDTIGGGGYSAAVADAEGGIWLFWGQDESIRYARRHPLTESWEEPRPITEATEATEDYMPFILSRKDGGLWLFWNRQLDPNKELFYRRLITSI